MAPRPEIYEEQRFVLEDEGIVHRLSRYQGVKVKVIGHGLDDKDHDLDNGGQDHASNRCFASTVMHMWYEFGECCLHCSQVITLTMCYGLGGPGHDLKDESQGMDTKPGSCFYSDAYMVQTWQRWLELFKHFF